MTQKTAKLMFSSNLILLSIGSRSVREKQKSANMCMKRFECVLFTLLFLTLLLRTASTTNLKESGRNYASSIQEEIFRPSLKNLATSKVTSVGAIREVQRPRKSSEVFGKTKTFQDHLKELEGEKKVPPKIEASIKSALNFAKIYPTTQRSDLGSTLDYAKLYKMPPKRESVLPSSFTATSDKNNSSTFDPFKISNVRDIFKPNSHQINQQRVTQEKVGNSQRIFYETYQKLNSIKVSQNAAAENIRKKPTGNFEHMQTDNRLPNIFPNEKNEQVLPFEQSTRNKKTLVLLFRSFKKIFGTTSDDPRVVAEAYKRGKYQKKIPLSQPFPCNVTAARSPSPPATADRVRPGDIDVVAAFGDSLTSGSGIAGSLVIHSAVSNRGLSGLGGGQGTWREFLTIPNILKEFNPKLRGYSTGDTFYHEVASKNQQLNVAEPAAIISDLPHAVRILHQKMKNHTSIDINKDWKLISIMIGSVDQCLEICYWKRPQEAPKLGEKYFRDALDYLMDNFPRTIVLIVVNLNLPKYLESVRFKGPKCHEYQRIACPCIHGPAFRGIQKDYRRVVDSMLEVQKKIGQDERYKKKADFRIITSSVIDTAPPNVIPKIPGTDYTDEQYLAGDCFHLSQKGQAMGARNIWNSLFEKNESKWSFTEDLRCPTEQNPYF